MSFKVILFSGTVVGQDYAMTGFSMEGPVPSLLRLPVEILFLSSFAGFMALIRGYLNSPFTSINLIFR